MLSRESSELKLFIVINVKKVAKPQSGGAVSRLVVPKESGSVLCPTKKELNSRPPTGNRLEAIFKTARGAPIYTGPNLY